MNNLICLALGMAGGYMVCYACHNKSKVKKMLKKINID